MKETVEQFLARGGKIQKIETGKSGLDMATAYKDKVKRSTHARYNHKSGVPITVNKGNRR